MRIVTLGEQILRSRSEPVADIDGDLNSFVGQMFEAMYDGRGIGLAAVQVGSLIRVFVTHVPDDEPRVFINPQIIETSVEQWKYEEGCLSIPGLNADVVRPRYVRVQAWNARGRPFTIEVEGVLGRVIQHEQDHLEGVLFIDKISKGKREKLLKGYDPEKALAR
jgi:peptide deformylase